MIQEFKATKGTFRFTRVDKQPCESCKHSAKTIDAEILACMYWNAFTKQGESCGKWEAK